MGVLESALQAPMRLTRVRYSLAEYTPLKFSPGTFMNTGRPAPTARKSASYSSRSSGTV